MIKENILDKSSAFQNWTEQVSQTDEKSDSQSRDELTEFQQEVEKVIMEVLLVVQRLVKGQGQSQEDETANQREDSGEDGEIFMNMDFDKTNLYILLKHILVLNGKMNGKIKNSCTNFLCWIHVS